MDPKLFNAFSTRNPLAFPTGVNPGFNPNHLALAGHIGKTISVVANGPGFTCVNRGLGSTVGGTIAITSGVDAYLGPYAGFTNGTVATNFIEFITGYSGTPTAITYAGIFTKTSNPGSSTADDVLISSRFTNSFEAGLGPEFKFISSHVQLWLFEGGTGQHAGSALTLTLNVPYFFAVSNNVTTANWIIINLKTGLVYTTSVSGITIPALGNYSFGGDALGGSGGGAGANLAAGVVIPSTRLLSLQELRMWGNDPWSFWYPDDDFSFVGSSAIPAWGFDNAWERPIVSSKSIRHAAMAMHTDRSYAEGPLINWFNTGWEIQPPQPPAYPRTKQKYPGTKGKSGFGFFPLWQNLGWEIQYRDIKHPKFNSPDVGDGGTENVFSAGTVAFPEFGHDPTWADLRHIFKHSPEIGDAGGINAQFINWFNAGWEKQYDSIKHPKFNAPEIGDPQGINAQFINWINQGWPIQYWDVRHPKYNNPDIGDIGIQSPYILWNNTGWEIQYRDIIHPRPERAGSILVGDLQGINAQFINWINQGWPIQYWDIKHPKFNSPDVGDAGIVAQLINWFNAGWEIQYRDIKHPLYRSPDVGDTGIENVFSAVAVTFPEWGHDPTWADLRHIWLKSPDVGDPQGINAQFINWINQGWPIQYWDVKHPKYNSPDVGDPGGIDAQFRQWYNAGWEVQPPQPPHKWFKSPEVGDQGTETQFINWINQGWPIQYWDVRHPKFNNPDLGDGGIEATFTPPGFVASVPWAFQTTNEFPFRFNKSPEIGDQGIQDLLRRFFPYGWEKRYEDIRHYFYKNLDRGDEGIEAGPFFLIPLGKWDFPTMMVFSRTQFGPRNFAGTIFGAVDPGSWPPGTIIVSQNVYDWLVRMRRRGRR